MQRPETRLDATSLQALRSGALSIEEANVLDRVRCLGIVTVSQYRRLWGHFGYLARALTRWIRSPEPNTLGRT